MANHIFLIEFKFPVESVGEWVSFGAKAKKSLIADVWEIYALDSDRDVIPPFEKIELKRTASGWIEQESGLDSLASALIGRAIEKQTKAT